MQFHFRTRKYIYLDKNQQLQATAYRKETRQSFLQGNSELLLSLKKIILFSQALRLKRITSIYQIIEKVFGKQIQTHGHKKHRKNK